MARWLGKIMAQSHQPQGWFAAPAGSAGNNGSFGSPWDLQTAFDGGSAGQIQPGDNVWLRGGTYTVNATADADSVWRTTVSGTAGNLITFRSYIGEWAILDGEDWAVATCLKLRSSYVKIYGIQVCSSLTDRTAASNDSNPDPPLSSPHTAIQNDQGFGSSGTGCKVINCIVKNLGQGVSTWTNATDTEVYGNLIYYNGWNGPASNWGNGCYSQNQSPSTHIYRDNIFFANNEYNIQVYGESAELDNHTIEGNICFADAVLSTTGGGGEVTIGGGLTSPTGNVFSSNSVYGRQGGGVCTFERGNDSLVCTNNLHGYAGTSGGEFNLSTQTGTPVVTGNYVYSGLIQPAGYATSWPTNNWFFWSSDFGGPDAKPTGAWASVRPNAYDSGICYVAIFNWDHSSSVSVNVSAFLGSGQSYVVFHAMDPQGTEAASGTLSGTNISFPMTGLTVETPVGWSAPSSTAPEFAAFIVVKA